jgi:hypothetical protein
MSHFTAFEASDVVEVAWFPALTSSLHECNTICITNVRRPSLGFTSLENVVSFVDG